MENDPSKETVESQSRSHRQFTLLSVLLLTAAIASWLGYLNARKSRLTNEVAVQALKRLARELEILDPNQYAAVKQRETYVGESIWKVYLPPGRKYQLNLALESLPTIFGTTKMTFPSVGANQQVRVDAGQRRIELKVDRQKEGATIQVYVDDVLALDIKRDAAWSQSNGSSSGTVLGPIQQEVEKPLVLHHHVITSPPAPASENGARGELLWVEKLPK